MKRPVHFAAKHAPGRADVASGARLVNLYAQAAPPEAEAALVLYGTAGTALYASLGGTTSILGMHKFGDLVYAVTQDTLYSVDVAGTVKTIGSVLLTGQCSIADNGTTMVIVDGARGYSYDGTTLAQIVDPAFYPSDSVTYFDGYLVFVRRATNQFFISGLNAITFDATDFASAESSTDDLIAVLQDHRELWLFGERTIEVYYNRGDADFPFRRIEGAVIEHGIASAHAAAKADNAVYTLSDEGIVYAHRGYSPTRISTHEIEALIAARDTTTAVAFAWYDEGHTFVQWTVGADLTIVYDAATNLWHTRSHIDHGRHHAGTYVRAFGKHLVGDFSTGKVYEMRLDTYDDAGRPMIAEAIAAPLAAARDRLGHNSFEARFQPGVGITTGQGSDPQVMLQFSDDSGATWSSERWKPLGKMGKRLTRQEWRRLGQARSRQYRLTISDPVQRAVLGTAYADVERHA